MMIRKDTCETMIGLIEQLKIVSAGTRVSLTDPMKHDIKGGHLEDYRYILMMNDIGSYNVCMMNKHQI
jgi:hypothetical protein